MHGSFIFALWLAGAPATLVDANHSESCSPHPSTTCDAAVAEFTARLRDYLLLRQETAPDLLVVAVASSIGLTFSLYFAIALFPAGPLLAELKLGALLTAAALPLAFGAARLLRVGRFHQRPHVFRR